MKTMICVKGSSQIGKTPSICDLCASIIQESEWPSAEIIQNKWDFECKGHYRGVLVGFYSCGDPGCEQYKHLTALINDGCEIVICSCRNWGQTRNDVEKVAKENGYDLIYTTTYHSVSVDDDFLRRHFVKALVDLVDSRI